MFTRLEVLIYLERHLIADLNFEKSPGEITRIVLFRFMNFIGGDEKYPTLKNLS
jgi:hypothetical protein